jgi:hypothetical protein
MGLFYLQTQNSNEDSSAMLFLFSTIVIFNIYFLLLWLTRFIEVLLRTYIDKLKTYKCFRYLFGDRTLDNYD